MRIGWVRGPADLIARLAAARTTLDLGSPVVEQLAAAELLARADTVLPGRRTELAGRRDHLLTLLEPHDLADVLTMDAVAELLRVTRNSVGTPDRRGRRRGHRPRAPADPRVD